MEVNKSDDNHWLDILITINFNALSCIENFQKPQTTLKIFHFEIFLTNPQNTTNVKINLYF